MENTKTLAVTATNARLLAVQMVHDAASGHPGGSLSCLDVLTTLYFHVMHVDPKNPLDPDRVGFVMCNVDCATAMYRVVALRGFFTCEALIMLGSIL